MHNPTQPLQQLPQLHLIQQVDVADADGGEGAAAGGGAAVGRETEVRVRERPRGGGKEVADVDEQTVAGGAAG